MLPDAAAVAAEAARRFVAAVGATSGTLAIALAGGSTPKAAYALLGGTHAPEVDWARVTLVFGDERCVPPDHADSNHLMVKRALLDPLAAQARAPREVLRIEGELDPDEAARRYAARLAALPGHGAVPRLDLVLLGMGADGHTASLFPGSPVLTAGGIVAATPEAHAGHRRVTLTYGALDAARAIVVLVTGAEKAGPLKLALDGPVGAVPLRDVRPTAGSMIFVCDRAAAPAL